MTAAESRHKHACLTHCHWADVDLVLHNVDWILLAWKEGLAGHGE